MYRGLVEGDQILALDGKKLNTPYQLLAELQSRHNLVIIERNPALAKKQSIAVADAQLGDISSENLSKIISSIGSENPVQSAGELHLLGRITPRPLNDFPFSKEQKEQLVLEIAATRKAIEAIQDPAEREVARYNFETSQKKLVLGLSLVDREVLYNPSPIAQFGEVFKDTYRTLTSLFSGAANPKFVAGPVGIIQIVHQSWMIGIKEALFWMALISLNLGIINLMPLPVLDGGHIVFSFIEMFTKRPIKAKTMEMLIIPFVVLLIGFFVFVTYNDISRLFSKFIF
jgi:regulator of sigma E protease